MAFDSNEDWIARKSYEDAVKALVEQKPFDPKRINKFYLAGPFFNPVQIADMQIIESAFIEHNVAFYSPRMHPDNEPGLITREKAERIFKRNVENITDCTAMLAVLDWSMPNDCQVWALGGMMEFKKDRVGTFHQIEVLASHFKQLNIPDGGTVFEMGFAHARGIPIFGFTQRREDEALNLMLTQSCRGVIHGLAGLAAFLNVGKFDLAAAPAWVGRNA